MHMLLLHSTALAYADSSPVQCPTGMQYAECGQACNKTCAELAPVCATVCIPRCECTAALPVWFPARAECGAASECTLATPPTAEALLQLPNRPPPPASPPSPPSRPPPPPLPPRPPQSPPKAAFPGALAAVFVVAIVLCCSACLCICVRTRQQTGDAPGDTFAGRACTSSTSSASSGSYRPLLVVAAGEAAAVQPTPLPWTFRFIRTQAS